MAIEWDVKITPIDIQKFVASIRATRTDTDDPGNPMTYVIPRAVIETEAQQIAAMDRVWAKHQTALLENTAVAAFVNAKQTAGKENLKGRE